MRRVLALVAGWSVALSFGMASSAAGVTIAPRPDDGKRVVYFADWTTTEWPVWWAVKRWNRSPHVRLRQVPSCDGIGEGCVTIINKWDYDRHLHPDDWGPRSTGGTWWSSNVYYDELPVASDLIEVYDWVTDRRQRQRIVCHELGHFLLQDGAHPDRGCMSYERWFPYPGEWLKRHVR